MIKLDLNGSWMMKASDEQRWIPAIVPGSAASDLLREGLIPDPYYRDNEYEVRDRFQKDYEYRRQFEADKQLLTADRLELVCEGLDTVAEVRLNGHLAATTENMHRTYRIDIKSYLQPGINELHITFRSPLEYVRRKQEQFPLWSSGENIFSEPGLPHLRKAHYMFGWDWGPQLPDCGIWRDISLHAYYVAAINDVYVTQDHSQDDAVSLDIRVQLQCFNTREWTDGQTILEAVLIGPGGERFTTGISQAGEEQHLKLQVTNPKLWWPNHLGEQPLYKLIVMLRHNEQALDQQELTIGLRTLTVRNEPDEWGESFEFVVNGLSIFAMGADYIPEDNLRARMNRSRTEQLVRDCVQANFNCIRVWGGGVYPDNYFYDLCDQYGLIVWQDHLFACAEYRMDDHFTEQITREIEDNVRRLRHHASLGIWCGNNEMEMAWVQWNFPKRPQLRTDYIKQFEVIMPELSRKLDPNTFYWKASPSSGGSFDEPNAPHRGNVHYWEVWHGGKPFTEYRKHYFRFCSEFGFQSFPTLKTVEAFTEAEDRNIFTPVMESHQKNPAGNGKILFGISENFLYPKDFDSLLYVSQLLQAEAMRYGVEHWRRNRGRCMGSIYWQLNDCWPVASWASLDYYGRWKALHYSAKRFYAPVLLSAEEEGTEVKLAVTNDTLQKVQGTVKWYLRSAKCELISSGELPVEVDPLSAKAVAVLDFAEQLPTKVLRRQTYCEFELIQGDKVISESAVLFVKPKHYQYECPEISSSIIETDDHYEIELNSQAFAQFVELRLSGRDARFSDNYFHLTAGRSRIVTVDKAALSVPASLDELQSELTVRSLYDSY